MSNCSQVRNIKNSFATCRIVTNVFFNGGRCPLFFSSSTIVGTISHSFLLPCLFMTMLVPYVSLASLFAIHSFFPSYEVPSLSKFDGTRMWREGQSENIFCFEKRFAFISLFTTTRRNLFLMTRSRIWNVRDRRSPF